MGLYFRKSVRVGPLRFNFSKSGIGLSAGIPGFRVGMGPRGNYVHMGRGGLYYRATLPNASSNTLTRPASSRTIPSPVADPTLGPEVAIDSGSVLAMVDHSAAGLLYELNEKRSRLRLAPSAGVLSIVLLFSLRPRLRDEMEVTLAVVCGLLCLGVYYWDAFRKTTVVMYELEDEALDRYETLHAAIGELRKAKRMWHVSSSAVVLDRKYHAGASSSVRRASTSVAVGSPPFVKSNVDVPSIGVGRQRLFLFPDRILVFDAGKVGAVSYADLEVKRTTTRFVEEGGVPGDSRVVDRTWRYVNKNGGPDKRFKDNREIPICEYEELNFRSPSGLNELLQMSLVGAGLALEAFLRSHPSEPQRLVQGLGSRPSARNG
ncbi:MAG: Nucleotide-binding protein [Gemmatimonadetes bacterium]|nr:Nucleotide-binding protein [Gemmatimonadota bacterium]